MAAAQLGHGRLNGRSACRRVTEAADHSMVKFVVEVGNRVSVLSVGDQQREVHWD